MALAQEARCGGLRHDEKMIERHACFAPAARRFVLGHADERMPGRSPV
jgi:hypothetical protein